MRKSVRAGAEESEREHAPSVIGKLRAAARSSSKRTGERAKRRNRAAIPRGRLLATTRSFARDAKLLPRAGQHTVSVPVCVSLLLAAALRTRARARKCTRTRSGLAVCPTVHEQKVGACVPATFVHRRYTPRNFTTGLYRTHGGTSLAARHSCGRGVFHHRDKAR